MEEVTPDNYRTVNIENIALDRNKLGTLVFEKSSPQLKSLQELFSELEELSYKSNLVPQEVEQIDSERNTFITRLNEMRAFDISQPDPGAVHDQIEQNIESFYYSATQRLRPYLVALRQEVALKSTSQKELQHEAKLAQQARKKSEDVLAQLETQLKNLEEQKNAVEKGHGQLASKTLAKHFDEEAQHFEGEARKWLKERLIFFWTLVAIVAFNLTAYVVLKTGFLFFHKVNIEDFFNAQYLAIKVALIALLSYGLAFTSKNYRINSNLAVMNRHRRSVAQTIEDYLETNPRPEIQDQLIKEGVSAMFQSVSSGYLSNKETPGDGNPATEFITNIIKNVGGDKSTG